MSTRERLERNKMVKEVLLPTAILLVLMILTGSLFYSINQSNTLQANLSEQVSKLAETKKSIADLTESLAEWTDTYLEE